MIKTCLGTTTTTTTMLIILKEEMEDILKIVKYLEYSSLLIKSVIQTIKNRRKEQREGFLVIRKVVKEELEDQEKNF